MSATQTRIGPADHGRRMTHDEFREAEEEPGYRYELARGVLEVSEFHGDDHGQIVHNLHEVFSIYRRDHPGLILRIGHGSDVRFVIPEFESERHLDLALIFRDAPTDDRGRRRAAMAVEVVSPGAESRRRDYREKREEYLRVGLLEYWIVDPQDRRVTVLALGDGSDWAEAVFRDDEPVVSGLLPGLALVVARLWADAAPFG